MVQTIKSLSSVQGIHPWVSNVLQLLEIHNLDPWSHSHNNIPLGSTLVLHSDLNSVGKKLQYNFRSVVYSDNSNSVVNSIDEYSNIDGNDSVCRCKSYHQIVRKYQIKAVTSCSTHKIDQQETDG